MKKFVICATVMLLAAGCAKAPEDIAAMPVPTDAYIRMQCPELSALRSQKQAEFEALEKQQLSVARQDATGMATIHIPYGSMAGGDREPQYARAKGEIQAINSVYRSKACNG